MRIQLTLLTILLSYSFSIFAQTAPDFKITTSDKEDISLYANYLDKGKSVVIELFFVDCPPCRSFAPFMANLHTQMLEREIPVEFISLSVVDWDTDETVNGFKSEFNHDWPFAHFGGGSEAASEPYRDGTFGQYFGTPAIAVISPDGTVNYVKRVFNNEGYIAAVETAILDSQTAFNEGNEPATAIISGGINTLKGEGLSGVTVNFTGAKDTTIITDANGDFQTGSLLADESYTISLEKNDNPTNGVTTLDIIFISKHILGIDTFDTPQKYIAADVNNSGGVTTFDIVHMRQLILGIISEFPNNKSWVFEPATLEISSLADLGSLSFTAIKIGDLNDSAKTDGLTVATDRQGANELNLTLADQQFEAGNQVSVVLNSADLGNIQGFQFTLSYNPSILELVDLGIGELPNYSAANFNLLNKERGLISTSWDTRAEQNAKSLFTLNFKAIESGRLSDIIQVNSDLTSATAYDWNAEVLGVKLSFSNENKSSITDATLFPNPSVTNTVFLKVNSTEAKLININVMDLTGSILRTFEYLLKEGTQVLPIQTLDFPAGVYTLQLNQGKKTLNTIRLIKQ